MIPRKIHFRILEALKVHSIVLVAGIKQAGKTTLLQDIIKEIGTKKSPATYMSLNRPVHLAALAAPEAFLRRQENNLVIEEVQMISELFTALRSVMNDSMLKNKSSSTSRYLLTASADILSIPKYSAGLFDDMHVLTMYPFCAAEAREGKADGLDRIMRLDFSGLVDNGVSITAAIRSATFPEIADKSGKERSSWFDGLITSILQHEVRQLADPEKIAVLPALLRVLAARAGSLVNDSEIARAVGLNSVTGKFYRSLLKTMLLSFDVQPWFRHTTKRLIKAPKSYLVDTLMLCHMLDLNLKEVQKNKPDVFGRILENYVATELTKLLSFSRGKGKLLHFRTSDNKKVDFILEKPDGSLIAIDIKNSEAVIIHDFKGISIFSEAAGSDFSGGIVLYTGRKVVSFGRNLWGIPLYILWQ